VQTDLALFAWKHGSLDAKQNWQRIAVDDVFVSGKPYLAVGNCGSNRLIVKHLGRILLERDPLQKLICDHGSCFKSSKTKSY